MAVYFKFMAGLLILGLLMGFVIPTLLSGHDDILVLIGIICVLFVIPGFIRWYWDGSWEAIRKAYEDKKNDAPD